MSQVEGLLLVAGNTLAIYAFLIVALSRVGRRQMAQLTPLEYAIVALLGSAVETGLYAGSSSVSAGLVSAVTLLLANWGVAFLMARSRLMRRLLLGTPIVLVRHRQLLPAQLRRAHLTEQDVLRAIRLRGYGSLDEVRFAVLELNGTIGVVPMEAKGG